jgi:hypothetical protein
VAGIPFDSERVGLKSKLTLSGADFTRISPKGYVPALVRDVAGRTGSRSQECHMAKHSNRSTEMNPGGGIPQAVGDQPHAALPSNAMQPPNPPWGR